MPEDGRKSPEHLTLKSKKEPLSTRIKTQTKWTLKLAARYEKTSVSDLAAAILDDYAEWLQSTGIKLNKSSQD